MDARSLAVKIFGGSGLRRSVDAEYLYQTEVVALGSTGGCFPVLLLKWVLHVPMKKAIAHFLFCSISVMKWDFSTSSPSI